MHKTDLKTGFAYWFVHFAVEVLCFYTLYKLFQGGRHWWLIGVYFDTLAFVPQAFFGAFCEKHPGFRPGLTGGILITVGAFVMLLTAGVMTGSIAGTGHLDPDSLLTVENQFLLLTTELFGLLLLTAGNGLIHITGALATLRVSRGRLAESAIFVGGGSFGVIVGRILAGIDGVFWIPFVLIAAATVVMVVSDRSLRKKLYLVDSAETGKTGFISDTGTGGTDKNKSEASVFDFDRFPCVHRMAADRRKFMITTVLAAVVAVRAYIGYGLPTAWNKTLTQTVLLFVFMGCGKMAGGILSDIFGARATGIVSCLLAAPLLLISNNIMWLSLIGVAMFSMTMAVTLGGLVSVMPKHPGIAFGITTFALWFGSMPVFIFGLPSQLICNILIVIMSVLAAAGLFYSLRKKEEISAAD